MSVQRPIRLPLPSTAASDLPVTSYRARSLWRLHEKGTAAVYFSLNPDHRFSHPASPHKVLYLGENLTTCIWERFGDEILNEGSPVPRALWTSRSLSRVKIPMLKLCDFTDEATLSRAKVDLSALKHPDLSVPQAWGLAVQNHHTGFDGLRYLSRFDGKPCIALFERVKVRPRLCERYVCDLVDSLDGDAFLAKYAISLV